MSSIEADAYITGLNKKVRPIAQAVHDTLISLGCTSYVKTIYIGYDLNGEMVAASYGHGNHVEVALALAEDHPDERLQDASHLTWRTRGWFETRRSLYLLCASHPALRSWNAFSCFLERLATRAFQRGPVKRRSERSFRNSHYASELKLSMALIDCAECGERISDKAPACPKCGVPLGDGMTGKEVTLLIKGFPRTMMGKRLLEVYFNGDHIGTVPKAETKRISLPSGGDVEFVTKTPPSGLIKRF